MVFLMYVQSLFLSVSLSNRLGKKADKKQEGKKQMIGEKNSKENQS